jgi:hypothetical protein
MSQSFGDPPASPGPGRPGQSRVGLTERGFGAMPTSLVGGALAASPRSARSVSGERGELAVPRRRTRLRVARHLRRDPNGPCQARRSSSSPSSSVQVGDMAPEQGWRRALARQP